MAFVYVIGSDVVHHKIGVSENLRGRLSTFQTANHRQLRLVFAVEHPEAYRLEGRAHGLLRCRHVRGEWFRVSAEGAIDAVRHAVAEQDLRERSWVMVGDAVRCVEPLDGEAVVVPALGGVYRVDMLIHSPAGRVLAVLAEFPLDAFPCEAFMRATPRPSRARVAYSIEQQEAADAA